MYSGLENVGIFAIKDVGRISFISNKTGEEKVYINFANKFDFSATGETVKAKGNGSDMVSFDQPKQGEGTFDLELTSLEVMSFANGSKLKTSAVRFYNRDEFEVKSNDEVVQLSETPTGVVKFYKLQKDRRTKIGELATATVNEKSATLTGAKTGDIIVATYFTSKEALNFTIKATNELSESCTMVLRCKGKTHAEGAFVDMQLTFPNVNTLAENAFSFDAENVSPFTLKVDILGDSLEDMVNWAFVPDIV
jgi:hypothetical protein